MGQHIINNISVNSDVMSGDTTLIDVPPSQIQEGMEWLGDLIHGLGHAVDRSLEPWAASISTPPTGPASQLHSLPMHKQGLCTDQVGRGSHSELWFGI